jgi:glycosyltransferase involved in cell wall biosynthesis
MNLASEQPERPTTRNGPAVSVLMTAYNRAAYIGEAIESVLAQTFTDFELVVVDDCSTDGTADIAADYAGRDPRVRVVRNERNLGDYPNRNRAARLVRAPYFKYHDSDDVMYSHCLQVMYGMLADVPQAAFALSASSPWPGRACPMLLTPTLAFEREFLGAGLFHLGPAAALFRTDFFRSVGGFPEMGIASDTIFWPRACRAGAVLLVPGDLFFWREHAAQEYGRLQNRIDRARATGETWRTLFDPSCPLSGDALEQARTNYAYIVVRAAYRYCKRGDLRMALESLRRSTVTPSQFVRYLRPPRRFRQAGTPA